MLASMAPALAADPIYAPAPAPVSNDWIITIIGNARVSPKYPGADELGFFAFPSFAFRRVGEPKQFTTPDDGFSLPVYDTATLRFGLTGRYRGGRYLDTDRRLFGLEDVKWAVEPGLFVEYWPLEALRLRAEARYGLNGYEGFVGDLAMDLVGRFGQFTVSAGPRLALGGDEFTQTYFGILPFESSSNGVLAAYRPSGGVTSVGVSTALSYDWSETWSTTVSASYSRLVGDAADSPIVKRFGSENQFGIGASLSYSFSTGAW